MFDFLKKSRAVKFLCSACLLCSLGSFATINAETPPKKVADVYMQGELGYGENTIVLDSATLSVGDNGGQLSGTLKWRGPDEAGNPADLIDLTNGKEDAGITFYLAEQGSSSQLAVSNQQSLGGSYSIDLQFYASAEGDTIGAGMPASPSEYRPTAPGVFEVWAIVSNPGATTLISGPNA